MTDDVGLRVKPIAHLGDVLQIDGRVPDLLDRQVVQLRHGLWARVQTDVIFEGVELHRAGGGHQVLLAYCCDNVGRGQAFRLQRARMQTDHDLSGLAAIG